MKTYSKKRCANHERSFNINRYKNDTKLSVEYWNLKAGNSNPKVTWAVKKYIYIYIYIYLNLLETFDIVKKYEKTLTTVARNPGA